MEVEEKMTAEELARANEWLIDHGHTYEELADFAHYIARKKPINAKEKSQALPNSQTGEPD